MYVFLFFIPDTIIYKQCNYRYIMFIKPSEKNLHIMKGTFRDTFIIIFFFSNNTYYDKK